MAFLGTTSALDDYKNDIKPDQSVPNYNDSISSIAWASQQLPNYFATTSWDGELRVLSVEPGQFGNAIFQKLTYKFPLPALKCTWNDQNNHIYVGLIDGTIKVFDVASQQVGDIGRHGAGISSLHFVPGMNAIISTAYENNIHVWQPGNPNPLLTINADNKVFTSDFQFPTLVAGTANEKILAIDINNTSTRTLIESTDLGKYSQIQSIAINQKCTTFGVASFDGRANLSSLNKNVNGLYAPVPLYSHRNQLLLSKATNTKKQATQFSTPLTVLHLTPLTNVGS